MTATTECNLLTKADRICERLDDLSKIVLQKENVSREEFKDFLVSVRLIVTTELNEKGVERTWKN